MRHGQPSTTSPSLAVRPLRPGARVELAEQLVEQSTEGTGVVLGHPQPLDQAVAQDLVEKAHQVCPYSNATRGNVEVQLTVA